MFEEQQSNRPEYRKGDQHRHHAVREALSSEKISNWRAAPVNTA
jgi:hypothetical protein